jgi:hypothetical protein
MVVVVQADQVTQLKMARLAGSLAGNTFHSTSITKDAVGMIVDEIISRFIEHSAGMGLSDCKANGIGKPLAQRPCRDLNPGSIEGFRVPWCDAIDLLNWEKVSRFQHDWI